MYSDSGAFWKKKKKKSKVPELKEIKTLGGLIMKIGTSMAKLKIVANFRRVIRTFPQIIRLEINDNGIAQFHIVGEWNS